METGSGNDKNQRSQQQENRTSISRVSLALICASVFAFLASWAGTLANLGRLWAVSALVIMLLASAVFAFGLRLELRNHHWRKWQYNTISSALIALAFGFGLPAITREYSRVEQKPHLRLIINTADAPSANLALTNDFLFAKQTSLQSYSLTGYLLVPVSPERRAGTLKFSLANDSNLPVEGMQVFFNLDKDFKLLSTAGWSPMASGDTNSYSIGYRSSNTLLPGDLEDIPDMLFDWPKRDASNVITVPITVSMRAKNMPDIHLAFWIGAMHSTNPMLPRVVWVKDRMSRGTNGIAIDLPDDR